MDACLSSSLRYVCIGAEIATKINSEMKNTVVAYAIPGRFLARGGHGPMYINQVKERGRASLDSMRSRWVQYRI